MSEFKIMSKINSSPSKEYESNSTDKLALSAQLYTENDYIRKEEHESNSISVQDKLALAAQLYTENNYVRSLNFLNQIIEEIRDDKQRRVAEHYITLCKNKLKEK
ncbi:12017_t:CDS:1 [Racocetra fulgida]|uniref:12017_t:CDS:1 n=1 Tax=Racocetra fulgida TaxID=60492 RepID=A0A9N9NZV6_9GLOM|nr:12017_t:CDS:1 [Racocetra fulgida]